MDGILLAFDQFGDLDVVAGIAEAVSRSKGAKVSMVANDKQTRVAERAFQKAGVNMGKRWSGFQKASTLCGFVIMGPVLSVTLILKV